MNNMLKGYSLIIIIISLFSCRGSEYQELVKSELASGIRYDSIMFGIYFGDTRKDFYANCWKLNKQGVISHGPKNMNVQYTMKNEGGSDIAMLFYPAFDEDDRIRKMEVEYSYVAWAPWNEQYQADALLPVVQDTLMSWYPGNEFMELSVEEETYWVKVDGNRRINMKTNGKELVLVKVVDMLNEDN